MRRRSLFGNKLFCTTALRESRLPLAAFYVEPRNLAGLIGLASSIIAALRKDCCCSHVKGDGYNEPPMQRNHSVSRCSNNTEIAQSCSLECNMYVRETSI